MIYRGIYSRRYPPKVYITERFLPNLSPERVNLRFWAIKGILGNDRGGISGELIVELSASRISLMLKTILC
jgi:hypothetical protein